ncbi:hypothetical protein [uncultured Methanobrevibacter sp.]|uniref:hypothetical protein n=1 Tax=uncultured Methanobrevibacter sp. TaxID=253161 RepID=UPI0025CC5E37|nr:hypothetical protein [uncultured Methanobrevibacter sp.]
MKNVKTFDELNESTLNEAKNYTYSIGFIVNKEVITATVKLESANDASKFDKWLEEMKDDVIFAADGGPNEIEI